ncbi:hypothetical protein BHM03_00014255 [Ensete ventricosum]|nr:hypothetical protein BHM03_00014255 [Ensete ventricosum]
MFVLALCFATSTGDPPLLAMGSRWDVPVSVFRCQDPAEHVACNIAYKALEIMRSCYDFNSVVTDELLVAVREHYSILMNMNFMLRCPGIAHMIYMVNLRILKGMPRVPTRHLASSPAREAPVGVIEKCPIEGEVTHPKKRTKLRT